MKRIDFSRLVCMAATGATLALTGVTASATEIVRDSAGNLAPDYVQEWTQGYSVPGVYVPAMSKVRKLSTNKFVCSSPLDVSPGGLCFLWTSGYTATGNGYEVIKP